MKLLMISALACLACLSSSAEDARRIGYLVDQVRAASGSKKASILSGWEQKASGGYLTNGWGGLQIVDNSDGDGITLTRAFSPQHDGTLTVEFRFNVSAKNDGISWSLWGKGHQAVEVLTSGGRLGYRSSSGKVVVLTDYAAASEVGIKLVVDIDGRTVDLYVDGLRLVEKAAFAADVRSLDSFVIDTGTAGQFILNQRGVYIYRGYAVNEKFISQKPGALAEGWSVSPPTASAQVVRNEDMVPDPDSNSLRLTDGGVGSGVSLIRSFERQVGRAEVEFSFAQPAKLDGFTVRLMDGDFPLAEFTSSHGDLCCRKASGEWVTVWKQYASNVWYNIRMTVDPVSGQGDLFVNDIPVATGVALSAGGHRAVDSLVFATPGKGMNDVWLDDILVYPHEEEPADYVPAPVPLDTGDQLVGVQVCNLWREGHHIGWDWVSCDTNRTPIIGCYDEGNPEVADWEIKFLVDHGIRFVAPCWYRPRGGQGKDPMKAEAIGLRGYQRAKYASAIHYALIIETANAPVRSLADWRDTVVPFLVEHYFRDPRYLVLNNKPVVIFFGGIKGAGDQAVAHQVLIEACKAAGFDGATSVGLSHEKGFDYTYRYAKSFEAEGITNRINSPSVNWDRRGWDSPYNTQGTWKSAAEYQALLVAQKEQARSKTGLAKTLWMLGNWNEYGEGHFLMPTEGLGFRYLDAVRTVFGDGSAHQDFIPSEKQKARINVLYPPERSRMLRQRSTNESPKTK